MVDVVDPHRELPRDETKVGAEFGEKILDVPNERRLQVFLRIRAFESEEIEHVGVFENILVAHQFRWSFFPLDGSELAGVARERHALKQRAFDLAIQFAH